MPLPTARPLSVSLLAPLLVFGSGAVANAHGVQLEQRQSIEIKAHYDSGEPLAEAQVAVFAPGESEPLLTGTTNAEGQFQFVPDSTRAGDWSVQVRQAGHGAMLTIPVGSGERAAPNSVRSSLTPLQTLLLGATTLWGCIGTALFFARRPASLAPAPAPASLPSDSHAHS